MKLSEFKRLIKDGRVFECRENTFRPELNGQERMITKAQGNGFFWTVTADTDGKRYWTEMPKAADILEGTSDGFGSVIVKLVAPIGAAYGATKQHTLTLQFFLDTDEQVRT